MKKIFGFLVYIALVFFAVFSTVQVFAGNPEYVFGMLVWTSPAAVGAAQFQINYVPQFLIYNAAANPLTNLRIEDQELGVILDLPAAGILEIRNFMRFGVIASTVTMIRLANGHIRNRNVTVTATIAAAAAVPFQASSDCPGTKAFKYTAAALLAGQPTPFQDFTCLYLPGLAPGDNVLVEFANGHTQLFNEVELLELSALYQSRQIATGFQLNNINSYIHKATVTQAIAGAAYVQSVIL